MRHNHLLEPIRCLLDIASQPLSEYELIQTLQSQGWLKSTEMADILSLYGVHFLVYNALYQLKPYYQNQPNTSLFISVLAIEVVVTQKSMPQERENNSSAEQALTRKDDIDQSELEDLATFYLNWDNLDDATQESVDALLDGFWTVYVEDDEYNHALTVLQVDNTDDYTTIKQQYRRLAMEYHPDRGGDAEVFQRVQQAFSVVQRRKNQRSKAR